MAPITRLAEEERIALLRVARAALEQRLETSLSHNLPIRGEDAPALQELRGAFVTLHLGGHLRGCIGTFRPQGSLVDTVRRMAVAAALHDPRFPPLSPGELEVVSIEISALSPLQVIDDPEQVEVGRHGLYITDGAYSGVLLPQVATEWGWDREEFLDQTCRKAGLPPDRWRHGATIEVFTAEVFSETTLYGTGSTCND